jgi:competence ComEA-like helix-hairpin-helix protein
VSTARLAKLFIEIILSWFSALMSVPARNLTRRQSAARSHRGKISFGKNHASAGKEASTVAAAATKPLEQRRTGMAEDFAHLQRSILRGFFWGKGGRTGRGFPGRDASPLNGAGTRTLEGVRRAVAHCAYGFSSHMMQAGTIGGIPAAFCMSVMLKSIVSLFVIAMGLQFAAAQAPAAKPGTDAAASLPDGPGKAVVEKSCKSCHSIETVTKSRNTADGWADVVSQMIGRGANISDDDAETIVEYLAAHYGPNSKGDAGAAKPATNASKPDNSKAEAKTPVDVNKADAGELISALSLTKAEADAIVQYRSQHGDFKTWQDVAAVPGVDGDKIKAHQKDLTF